jgi:hypothetical protein
VNRNHHLLEERIVGEDHRSAVNRSALEEETIAGIIIDVLRTIPLSDISYRKIQVEIFKGRKKYLPEPYGNQPVPEPYGNQSERRRSGSREMMEKLISRHSKISPFLSYPLKDFISEDEMEIPLE